MSPAPPRILIVDDFEPILHSLRRALSSRGYLIQGVATGEAAIAAFEKFKPNVLIVDWQLELGDPWNGERLLEHFRKSRALKILMTGYADDGIRVRAGVLGAIWISKGEPLPQLLALLEPKDAERRRPSGVRERATFGAPEDGQGECPTMLADAADAALKLGPKLRDSLNAIEDAAIERTLAAHGGNLRRTALALGIERRSLQYRLRQRKR